MTGRVFLDTNLWVYLFSEEQTKKVLISELVSSNFENIQVSAQIVGELFNVLNKKRIVSLDEAIRISYQILDSFPVSSIRESTVKSALEIKQRYIYSYWDSLIIASAIDTGCECLYSEDMQHKHLIEGKLRIINPFIQ